MNNELKVLEFYSRFVAFPKFFRLEECNKRKKYFTRWQREQTARTLWDLKTAETALNVHTWGAKERYLFIVWHRLGPDWTPLAARKLYILSPNYFSIEKAICAPLHRAFAPLVRRAGKNGAAENEFIKDVWPVRVGRFRQIVCAAHRKKFV